MNTIIQEKKEDIITLCQEHHVKKLYVFGSVVSDDFNNESDIDFLYEFDTKGINFDKPLESAYDYADNFFNLKFSLEKLFQRKVDLIENKKFRNPYFMASVEKTKQLLYANN
jgi:uncharacterized protein